MKTRGLINYGVGAVGIVAVGLGCDLRAAQEFRTAAGPALEEAANALADGLIDGAFAVFEPDADDENSGG